MSGCCTKCVVTEKRGKSGEMIHVTHQPNITPPEHGQNSTYAHHFQLQMKPAFSRKTVITFGGAVILFFLWMTIISSSASPASSLVNSQKPTKVSDIKSASSDLSKGRPIMAKLKNETIRAELGRSAWKVFHTILAQYPEAPDAEEQETLRTYIHLFSRVYPCRECAEHFQELLKQFPPQTASREIASQWGCHVHNQVNKRLGKELFDCSDLSDKYACGCGDEDEEEQQELEKEIRNAKESLTIDVKEQRTSG